MQYPFTERVTEATKAQFKKQPSAVTAEAANRPTIKGAVLAAKSQRIEILISKYSPKGHAFLYHSTLLLRSRQRRNWTGTGQCTVSSRLICLIIKRVKGPRKLLLCL